MPSQGRADDRVEVRILRAPTENFDGKARVGDQRRGTPPPPRRTLPRDLPAAYRLNGGDHLAHRTTAAGAEIDGNADPAGTQALQRAQMRDCEVVNMHVVANRRPVRRRVIGTIDIDLPP